MKVWIHLLVSANYEPKEHKGVVVEAGQIKTSVAEIAFFTGLSEQSVRNKLTKLQSTNNITLHTTNKYSLITVVNWALYQSSEDIPTNKTTNKTVRGQQTKNSETTNNGSFFLLELKKEKKKESKEVPPISPLEIAMQDFKAMRKAKKVPNTDRAIELLTSRLNKLAPDDETKIKIINQSIERGWTTVYELKSDGKPNPQKPKFDYDQREYKKGELDALIVTYGGED